MKRNQVVKWRGFKARVEKVYDNELKIRITSTWAPHVPINEVKTNT